MKKYIYLSLLMSFTALNNTYAMDSSQKVSDTSSNKKTETPVNKKNCSQCKQIKNVAKLLAFCKLCKTKICNDCDFKLALQEKFFLDKTSDYFFIKQDCDSCKTEVWLYGTPFRSQVTQGLLMARSKDEQFERIYPDKHNNKVFL